MRLRHRYRSARMRRPARRRRVLCRFFGCPTGTFLVDENGHPPINLGFCDRCWKPADLPEVRRLVEGL